MNLGQNIATLRKEFQLTQEELAEKCEVSRQAVTKWESGASEPAIEKLVLMSNIFGVRIDDLIKDNEVLLPKKTDKKGFSAMHEISDDGVYKKTNESIDNTDGMSYSLSNAISSILRLSYNKTLGWCHCDAIKDVLLRILYSIASERFIDNTGKIREMYLLCNTSKEDREVIFNFAELTFLENENNPAKDYIEGKCEIDEALDMIDSELNNRINIIESMVSDKEKSKSVIEYRKIFFACGNIEEIENYSDTYIKKVKDKLHQRISDISGETLVDRLLIFFGKEIEDAIDRKDETLLGEIFNDMWALEDYFWYKG